MPVDVLVETTISRRTANVAAFAADPTRPSVVHEHQIRHLADTTPNRDRVPDGIRSALPRTPAGHTYEIVEFVPGQRLVMRTTQGPFPMETTYTWEPSDKAPG